MVRGGGGKVGGLKPSLEVMRGRGWVEEVRRGGRGVRSGWERFTMGRGEW